MGIITLLLQAFFLMLPAYFANMAPILFRKINFLNVPVDFGKSFGKERLFGSHKTWRGLFFATLTGLAVTFIQYLLELNFYDKLSPILILPYEKWYLIGFLLGFGAIIGDLVKSFFKRRLHIDDGKPLYFFDQIDYVVGAYSFLAIILLPPLNVFLASIFLSFVLTVMVNHFAFYTNLRGERW